MSRSARKYTSSRYRQSSASLGNRIPEVARFSVQTCASDAVTLGIYPAGARMKPMRYAILDLELSEPVPGVTLDDGQSGVAVLLRRDRRPVGFFMKRLSPGTTLGTEELQTLIAEKAGGDLL